MSYGLCRVARLEKEEAALLQEFERSQAAQSEVYWSLCFCPDDQPADPTGKAEPSLDGLYLPRHTMFAAAMIANTIRRFDHGCSELCQCIAKLQQIHAHRHGAAKDLHSRAQMTLLHALFPSKWGGSGVTWFTQHYLRYAHKPFGSHLLFPGLRRNSQQLRCPILC